ncbi:proto-oncogene tyrosine-protein kinase ROS [Anopheles sinensis]|uniref:Proto-oncogene tyrosine-protein kinase ROS n=1 Tax=Anopheles sinensis TaxID=74873 RepID=A0A084WKD8_ANOSI|nr:proto-oncogene tyrosine-protein kinase ROS [Anopheles sinensis]
MVRLSLGRTWAPGSTFQLVFWFPPAETNLTQVSSPIPTIVVEPTEKPGTTWNLSSRYGTGGNRGVELSEDEVSPGAVFCVAQFVASRAREKNFSSSPVWVLPVHKKWQSLFPAAG